MAKDYARPFYDSKMCIRDRALERGIAAGVCFDAIACGAVKKKFLRLRKYYLSLIHISPPVILVFYALTQ